MHNVSLSLKKREGATSKKGIFPMQGNMLNGHSLYNDTLNVQTSGFT